MTMTTMITRSPPIVGVPHLTMWLWGPSSRIRLPIRMCRMSRM